MLRQVSKCVLVLSLAAGVGSLGACASGARSGAMTAPLDAQHIIGEGSPLFKSVAVAPVNGGKETNALLQSKISNEAFQAALEQSLALNAMLATANAHYTVTATLQDLKQPFAGFDMTVTASVHYVVTPNAGGGPVFDETITTPYTANFSDAFVGVERLRLANEGAVRTSIASFIGKLAAAVPAGKPTS